MKAAEKNVKKNVKSVKKAVVNEEMNCVQIAESLLKRFDSELSPMLRIVRKTCKEIGLEIPVGRGGRKFNAKEQKKIIAAIDNKYCVVE